jgi:hypothetical protein
MHFLDYYFQIFLEMYESRHQMVYKYKKYFMIP